MDQRIIKLYDRFTHGDINRREFLDRLAELAGSSAGAMALLPLLQNDYAKAETVAANDQRLTSETHKNERLSRAAESESQVSSGARHSREPRT